MMNNVKDNAFEVIGVAADQMPLDLQDDAAKIRAFRLNVSRKLAYQREADEKSGLYQPYEVHRYIPRQKRVMN